MKSFIKIYFWQFLSLISGFATMFVVTPYLSSNQSYFGIYSFVMSLNLFLSYADFGFMSAGIKFASEAFIQKKEIEEQKIFGFLFFVMSCVFLLFLIFVGFLYNAPDFVLKGITTSDEFSIARELLLIFMLSFPITLTHRIVQLVFNVRLEDYKYQRIYAISNLIKIGMALILFSRFEYPIVSYYAFVNFVNLIVVSIGIYIIIKKYKYSLKSFLSYCRFDVDIFKKTKSLAIGSFAVTISWILYYELDNLVIGNLIGVQAVAIFSVCLSLMTFSRSLFGILYNPFSVKFNHYLGEGKREELNIAFRKVIILGFPLSVFSTLILVLTMGQLIDLWVGSEYQEAKPIAELMYASYFFSFLSYPAGIAMIAKQKLNKMYLTSFLLPFIYWIGILLSYSFFGLVSFGLFKLIAFFICAVVYFIFCKNEMNFNWISFVKNNALGCIIVAFIMLIGCYFSGLYFPSSKSSFYLLIYLTFVGSLFMLSCLIFFFFSKDFRKIVLEIISKIRPIKGTIVAEK